MHRSAYSLLFLLGAFFLLPAAGYGQRGRRLDCPGAPRQAGYGVAPQLSWEVGAGLSRPFLYRNAAGSTGPNYGYNALATPYITATGYYALRDRLEVFAGLAFTQTWQGLSFDYNNPPISMSVNSYAGSFLLSLPVGVRYRASRALWLSAAPYLSYSVHRGANEGDRGSVAAYTYTAPEDLSRLNGGLRLAADVRLSKRLGAVLSCAADAGAATASYAVADLQSQGAGLYRGAMEPHLLHAGLGLVYHFRADEQD